MNKFIAILTVALAMVWSAPTAANVERCTIDGAYLGLCNYDRGPHCGFKLRSPYHARLVENLLRGRMAIGDYITTMDEYLGGDVAADPEQSRVVIALWEAACVRGHTI